MRLKNKKSISVVDKELEAQIAINATICAVREVLIETLGLTRPRRVTVTSNVLKVRGQYILIADVPIISINTIDKWVTFTEQIERSNEFRQIKKAICRFVEKYTDYKVVDDRTSMVNSPFSIDDRLLMTTTFGRMTDLTTIATTVGIGRWMDFEQDFVGFQEIVIPNISDMVIDNTTHIETLRTTYNNINNLVDF
jgi:hypothetical protein